MLRVLKTNSLDQVKARPKPKLQLKSMLDTQNQKLKITI